LEPEAFAAVLELAIKSAVAPLVTRLAALEAREPGQVSTTAAIAADAAALRERVAILEAREPAAGPPGPPGADGAAGRDGADGVGFDDLTVDYDGDRTLAFTLARGEARKRFPIVLPFLSYQGVFVDGRAYRPGDTVTWGGSVWHCQAATTAKPGQDQPASRAWVLLVKAGRDGRDRERST
jgi:hypothetical protein